MSRKTATPAPIDAAKTIAEFVVAANRDYGLGLPESWQAGSVLADVWALAITVTDTGDGYLATASVAYPNLGRGTSFAGRVDARLTRTGAFYLRNAIGEEQLTAEALKQLKEKDN